MGANDQSQSQVKWKNLTKGGASTYVEGFYIKRGVTIYEDSTKDSGKRHHLKGPRFLKGGAHASKGGATTFGRALV